MLIGQYELVADMPCQAIWLSEPSGYLSYLSYLLICRYEHYAEMPGSGYLAI